MLQRIRDVEARIGQACARAGRSREEIELIAVTKYVSVDTAREALDCQLRHVGENRWQDAKAKWDALGDRGIWHFIGHLQTNKVKDVVGKFAYIHSLDRLSLAQELERQAEKHDTTVNCFLQVNVSGEQSKYGLEPDQLLPFAQQLASFSRIRVVGLMTMAPFEVEAEATRPVFQGLRMWRDRLNEEAILPEQVRHLSMGMSNDFEVAVEEGATWLRLGTVLVGKDG